MPTARVPRPPIHNRLLTALPGRDLGRLRRTLEPVLLGHRHVLYKANEPISHVYFPDSGVISLVSIMPDGSAVEVATVGNEGMVGLAVFLGADTIPLRAFAQVPGQAHRLPAAALRDEVSRGGPLQALLQRYTQALFAQVAQSAVCNRVDPIEQRCARWLLMTHDRLGADEFPLTQEFLSQMLGVRRATVNSVARGLQRAGLINYTRGKITVLNRRGLEAASCKCYQTIRGEYDRLFEQYTRGTDAAGP